MEISYIISQIFVILGYTFLGISYYSKNRRNVLILSFLSLLSHGISYVFLQAYTGLAMSIVSIIRNIIFLYDENKNGKSDKIYRKDVLILVVIYIMCIVSAIFTYSGILSLLSVLATMLYTYSIWQKKTKTYKVLGLPIGIVWISYNIYIKSIFGIILETILIICSITGYILEKRRNKRI